MSGRIDAVPATTGRGWPTGVALLALVAAFGAVAGPVGAAAGAATALVGYGLGVPYAIAIGHVALLAWFPDGIDLISLAIVEAAFAAAVLAPLRRTASPGRVALVAVTSALSIAGSAWLVARWQPPWLAAATALALLALGAYGLHRLELVRLGLVPDADGNGAPTDGAASTPDTSGETTLDADPGEMTDTTDTSTT
ncbi:hypothetical protein [Natrinema salifodinae]|uniref:DUF8163 domain-containing protein n=1 Tax=Natrinema salifodinae TaxID=1202768 RepID=A0A1I0M6C7_9EURY|nr:hypothetical protein [Natrinema salifodinae]SEV83829.1 hypothetical protein SAMN05216285_0537 [Natrinema salifodinae]